MERNMRNRDMPITSAYLIYIVELIFLHEKVKTKFDS